MKIEGSRPDQVAPGNESSASQAADRVQLGREDRANRVPESGGDRVNLSSDARLMSSAVRAAETAPDVRPDVVERARQKLASGELGRDTLKLADRIIDSLLSH